MDDRLDGGYIDKEEEEEEEEGGGCSLMWDGANSSTGPTRDSSRSRPHLRQEAAAASVDLKMEFYLSLLVSALLVGATEANAPTRPQRETATAAAGTGAPAAAFQQQAAAAPQTNHPRSRPAEAAAELKEEEEEEADPSDWKDEPCNFNLFYACAANQLWEFHKSFRNYMSLQLQQEPQRQALFLRDLQVQYCRMMDANRACSSRLSEHGCGQTEVDWFRQLTVDFTPESLGGPAAEWKFAPNQCPWIRHE